ncbi:lipoate--protein ligase [Rhodohalobacter barkolensis]|uniref:lipoate--protein ligase n=1 Tax=Rhodohalobacter barkolensis TaxID=2053187 RepID=A0A2N0VIN3_9BACT|nr:lipoate--protein ligase [Rhodohalobacter barkolensis]PKD44046.1 lipoate--protein ligase [Rhodohalobacter barkolensis]
MIFIENEGITDPRINLALEEYALRNFGESEDYLLFYINGPSIIIGRNQNTLEEINDEYVRKNGIHVVRRMSGGGAVYHDHGNLNFSFITNYKKENLHNFKKFTKPVIHVLKEMGVDAEMSGRNDILAEGRKISGNAQFSTGKRMFSHGTLLFNSDLEEVTRALDVKMSKIESKGHKSVRSRVANISEFLNEELSVSEFRQSLLDGLYRERDHFETYHLTDDEWKAVQDLRDEKYGNWDWNFGRSPEFNIQRTKRFTVGEIDLRLDVEKGHIKNLKIYGDFFGKEPVDEIEKILKDVRYEPSDIEIALNGIDVTEYFGDVEKAEFLELVYGDDE